MPEGWVPASPHVSTTGAAHTAHNTPFLRRRCVCTHPASPHTHTHRNKPKHQLLLNPSCTPASVLDQPLGAKNVCRLCLSNQQLFQGWLGCAMSAPLGSVVSPCNPTQQQLQLSVATPAGAHAVRAAQHCTDPMHYVGWCTAAVVLRLYSSAVIVHKLQCTASHNSTPDDARVCSAQLLGYSCIRRHLRCLSQPLLHPTANTPPQPAPWLHQPKCVQQSGQPHKPSHHSARLPATPHNMRAGLKTAGSKPSFKN